MRNKKQNFVKFSRKAQVEDWLPIILWVLVMVFLFLIFLVPTSITKEKGKKILELQSLNIDSDQYLLDFLSLPFEFNSNKNMNVADAINYYFFNKDENLLIQIKAKSQGFFSKTSLETDDSSWSLEFIHSKKKKFIIDSNKGKSSKNLNFITSKVEISKITIPTNNVDEFIDVRMFITTVNPEAYLVDVGGS